MSVETEVKAVEQKTVAEVAKVEADAKAEVAKVEADAKTVAEAVVANVKDEVAKDELKAKEAVVQTTTDEKLFLREAELEYLKAQMEIQRLSKLAEAKSKAYMDFIESLYKKYAITKAEYIFDGGVNAFKAIENKL
jgi:hypothetical protein